MLLAPNTSFILFFIFFYFFSFYYCAWL